MLAKQLVNFEVIDLVGRICQNQIKDTTFIMDYFVYGLDEIHRIHDLRCYMEKMKSLMSLLKCSGWCAEC